MSDLDGTGQAGPSQASTIDDESNTLTSNRQPGLCSVVQSIPDQPTTTDNSSSVSATGGETGMRSSESDNSTVATEKRKMPSPSSPSSESNQLLKKVKVSDPSVNEGESEIAPSEASFASDRDEGCGDTDSESSSDTESEEVLRVESEPPQGKKASPKSNSKVSQRTLLPSTRARRSAPLRVVKRGSKWSAAENALLIRLKNEGKYWDDISERLSGRTVIACKRHYASQSHRPAKPPKSVSARAKKASGDAATAAAQPGPRKAKWTQDEVDELRRLRTADVEWAEIARRLPGRTAAACRRKWQVLCKKAGTSAAKSASEIRERARAGAGEEGRGESSGDDGSSEDNVVEERAKRDIVEDSYSCDSDEEMTENGVDDQDPESKIEGEDVESVSDEDMADTSSESEEGSSEIESEDEAERKRQHATFFLKR